MRKQKPAHPISEADRAFMDQLFQKKLSYMLHIARHFGANPTVCEDVAQEAAMKLMNCAGTLQNLSDGQLHYYIYCAVQSAYRDYLRKTKKLISLDDDILEGLTAAESDLVPNLILSDKIQLLRSELTAREWALLEGNFILGYSHKELGKQLGVMPISVHTLLCRAKKHARQILDSGELTGGGGDEEKVQTGKR